ncbi:hypothetical protein [Streptomyces tauricus]|uniref:hypothetical protein n=1 Tax=Streptomyces tauricus TaxID=68274 RepID=UPI003420C04A
MTDPRVCRIKVHADVPPKVCDLVAGGWRLALVDGDTLVYLTARRLESGNEVRWELGAIGHGPSSDELTEYLCDEIRSWAPEQNTPSLIVYPAWKPVVELGGHLELTALIGIHRPRRVAQHVEPVPCLSGIAQCRGEQVQDRVDCGLVLSRQRHRSIEQLSLAEGQAPGHLVEVPGRRHRHSSPHEFRATQRQFL